MKMNKLDKIAEFLDYGGNELFSSLMTDNLPRAEGIDRLTELLKSYSDRCRRIKGRSAAYRYMLSKAEKNGWLGRGSADLYSHRLSFDETAHIRQSVDVYISSGGAGKRLFFTLISSAVFLAALILAFYFTYLKMNSEEYKRQMSEYYKSQVVIKYDGQTAEGIEFLIRTTGNVSEFIYMERMPELFYLTADSETKIRILPEKEISDVIIVQGDNIDYAQDPRSVYSDSETVLCLSEENYGKTFLPGKYRVEFDFYFYNAEGEEVVIPTTAEEIMVK